jgi:hypothetical protein
MRTETYSADVREDLISIYKHNYEQADRWLGELATQVRSMGIRETARRTQITPMSVMRFCERAERGAVCDFRVAIAMNAITVYPMCVMPIDSCR